METLKEDAHRLHDGSLAINYFLPSTTTASAESETCCASAFCSLYGLSPKTRILYAAIVKRSDAVTEAEVSELRTLKGESRRQNTLLWMKNEFEVLCCILPTSDYQKKDHHLPKCVSKLSIYQEYAVTFKGLAEQFGPEYTPFSRSTFQKLWLENFPYVTVPEHFAFSVCEQCADLHDRILFATKSKDRSKLVDLKKLRRIHLDFIAGERLEYREHQRLARESPETYVSVVVDGMDQAKLRGPHFAGGGIPKGK